MIPQTWKILQKLQTFPNYVGTREPIWPLCWHQSFRNLKKTKTFCKNVWLEDKKCFTTIHKSFHAWQERKWNENLSSKGTLLMIPHNCSPLTGSAPGFGAEQFLSDVALLRPLSAERWRSALASIKQKSGDHPWQGWMQRLTRERDLRWPISLMLV